MPVGAAHDKHVLVRLKNGPGVCIGGVGVDCSQCLSLRMDKMFIHMRLSRTDQPPLWFGRAACQIKEDLVLCNS